MNTVFETIKDRLPIIEVISSYITVEQSGSQYKAKCPFHNEKTPSFYISADRGLYYCFGCGAKGDIFNFVEQFEGLDKKGSLQLLAQRAGVVLDDKFNQKDDTDVVYDLLEKATLKYQELLKSSSDAQKYLENRGLLKSTIEEFRIGYVPDEWRIIESSCKTNIQKSVAIRAGLIKKIENKSKETKIYDIFRKRIMFPMMDSTGRVIAFSGRSFPEQKDIPKYLNSPETEIFKKSKTLFGFDKAKFHIKKNKFAILVEGQMDLVISHQAGFKNTVASSGTAVSENASADPFSNLSVLSRLSPNLIIAFDGDESGQSAMDKVALVALSLGMNPKVLVLPKGVDPADFIKEHGAHAWKEKLKESKHFIEHHLINIKSESLSAHLFVKKIKDKIFPFLSRVSSSMEKNLYVKMISQETGLDTNSILGELLNTPNQNKSIETPSVFIKPKELSSYERLIAIRKKFYSEEIENCVDSLNHLSIEENVFSSNAVPEEVLDRAMIIIEKEYSNLDTKKILDICKELVEKISNDFLLSNREFYSTELKKAEKNNNEIEVQRLVMILEEITKRLHKHSGA